ncbi:CCR4 NOT transcription complex subunit 7 [Echinococcus multilocularis]|uniref:poly(A)-specific ribonuclease n=1 Tax=Echinococcus multilocularis TaxID=6211 RepID=A0A068XYM4_ECHMU|nr:CCR4 NOT transcription complex subunit 7 [Echinococcus multilocularis]
MQPFRDIVPVTQNGFPSVISPNTNSDSPLNPAVPKYNNFRGNMAITTDMYITQHGRHNPTSTQFGHALQYHPNSLPQGLHNLPNSTNCQVSFNGFVPSSRVLDIWANNFHEGMRMVRRLAKCARYVAVDTEFPGVVAKVFGEYVNTFDQAYHNIKVNIDMLRPIQIGFSFFGERGQCVDSVATVQFNLKWNVDNETHAADSIQLLQDCGIDFYKLKRDGIEQQDFAEAFIGSGLALNDQITWIGFHSAYDFAYMMKICTDWLQMPEHVSQYQAMLHMFFPRIVDLKSVMSEHKFSKGGLQELADALHVQRVGYKHQAGSDSMLTGETFFRFLDEHSAGKLNPRFVNLVYGLNFCPNGSTNSILPMNGSPLESAPLGGMYSPSTSGSQHKETHSADHSGRNSPEGSLSGHKSS